MFFLANIVIYDYGHALPVQPVAPVAAQEHERLLPPEPIPPKPPEAYKPEEPHVFEKPTFIPAKPVPHSPKISPSSIPIPNPSVTTTKHVEPGYPNYGGFLYSIPGYSAFQPVSHSGIPGYHPGLVQQNQPLMSENSDFLPFTPPNVVKSTNEQIEEESAVTGALLMVTDDEETQKPQAQPQTDFEDHFTPEIISTVPITVSTSEATKATESKMSITSLAQGSGATVTIPSLIPSKDVKKKPERFSLKTSIPISKIDMKCVSNPPDLLFQNSLTKKSFKTAVPKDTPRIEIQSNIVIKSATKETEPKETTTPVVPVKSNTIKTLINAAESINKTENQFRVPETPKADPPPEAKKPVPSSKPLFNPMNIETTKASFTKPLEREAYSSDAKNQILFIQNKNNNNPNSKMLLTIQPQNPQVLLQRTNIDSKNLQAPSRPSNQSKKSKDDVMNEGTSSKVVALKRLHQENCDENDFENLITENQIYGNKIVVKEKSQGTLQEKDLKTKKIVAEKVTTNEPKNMVLQPNFLYLSNVQFPNMMIVKNNPKITQTADSNKIKLLSNESNVSNVNETNKTEPTTDVNTVSNLNKAVKSTLSVINKDIQVVKSSNNMQPTLQFKTKPDQLRPAVTKSDTITIAKPDNTVTTNSDIMIPKPDTEVMKPDIVIPNTAMSDMAIPDIVIPNMTMPDMVIPDIVIPNMAMPDMVIPNMTMPDIVIPNMTMSDVVIPDIVITQPDIVITQPNLIITQPNIVFTQPEYIFQANQNVIMNPQFVYQVPISSIIGGDIITQPTFMNISSIDYSKCMNTQTTSRQECIKTIEQTKSNEKLYISCPYQMDSKLQPKIVITNTRSKANKVEEVSSLDIYEKRRRLRRLKYLSNRDHNVTKDMKNDGNNIPLPAIIKKIDKNDIRDANIITPDKMKSEIYKEFASTKGKTDHGGTSGSDSDDGDELESKLYESIIEEYGDEVKIAENKKRKTEFLNNFRLASPEDYKEKELDLQERMLKHDKVRSAYAAAGRLDMLLNIPQEQISSPQRAEPVRISTCVVGEENLTMIRKKTVFLSHLKLTQASQRYKEEYEKAWQVIMKERHRRNGTSGEESSNNAPSPSFYLDSKGQLEMMTEIKQCVNENNNLIKKMLDTVHEKKANEDSISVLAERNFSELNRLSKIADQSVKLVSGQNTGQRDLNPGFDSENIQKQCLKIKQRPPKYHKLNIPSLSKIIALKSTQECPSGVTTQATSMDEPRSSAAGVIEISTETTPVADKVIDVCCQDEEHVWPGIAKLIKSYKNYDAVRRRKITTLQRRNTSLRVEGAHITRTASRDSDRARALLAERQNLVVEENKLLLSLQRLQSAIDEVKNYTGLHDFC